MNTNTPPTAPDPFDQAIEQSAEQLDEIASQTLADPDVQEALDDPEHDEDW